MQGQAKYDVFISYSRKDTAVANHITAVFEREGISYFIDRQDVGGGLEFPAVLAQAIRESRIFLFLASRNSYASKFTLNEIVYAFNKKEKTDIIPYIIDGSTLPDDLEFTFAAINWRDMRHHPIETTLVSDVLSRLGRKPMSTPQQSQQQSAPTPPPASQANVDSQQPQSIATLESPEPTTTKPVKPVITAKPSEIDTNEDKHHSIPVDKPSVSLQTVLSKWWILVLAMLIVFIGIAIAKGCNGMKKEATEYIEISASSANESIPFSCPDSNHPHAIDLGLPSGTKWACCNVGSTKPENYGDYFAWGETSTKSTYEGTAYRWSTGSDTTQTKYNTKSHYGIVDNRTQLEMDDDAARANWHGSWRMPTISELTELKANCSYEWTTVNGVWGGKFISHSNGRFIFLPAAGLRRGFSPSSRGEYGYYWSSSLFESFPYYAHLFYFYSGGVVTRNDIRRYGGLSVRPVLGN